MVNSCARALNTRICPEKNTFFSLSFDHLYSNDSENRVSKIKISNERGNCWENKLNWQNILFTL